VSSICEWTTGLDDQQFWQEFSGKIAGQRVPFSGSLALTHRCNLDCLHCYAREDAGPDASPELAAAQWQGIIGEIRDAGCLYLLLTGGEPLLREDFSEIYSCAKKSGFLVTVFTNGTLFSDRILGLFRDLPPRLVEISLYGASPQTHDRVTGVPGSFVLARRGIERLAALGVRVGLKSVMMTLNIAEFSAIEDLARGMGASFRMDPAIFPSLAGDRSPLDLRVPAGQAVAREFSDPGRARDWRGFYSRFRGVPSGSSVYSCAAGMSTFHVDPRGVLYPCVMAARRGYPLAGSSFRRRWQEDMPLVRADLIAADSPCYGCERKPVCGYCPGFFELENGDEKVPSAYLCEVGRLRYEQLAAKASGG
jgi:radical SAM protein with 4Fe4S-binding SPASM domain